MIEEITKKMFEERFHLPKNRPEKVCIQEFISNTLNEYMVFIEGLDLKNNLTNALWTDEMLRNKVRIISNGIIEAIEHSLADSPHLAYHAFSKSLDEADIIKIIELGVNRSDFDFFRLTKISKGEQICRERLFHIPFNLVHKVGYERFSIAGSPALYLGNSVLTCFKELNVRKNKMEDYYISRLKIPNNKKRFFDLRIRLDEVLDSYNPYNPFDGCIYSYLLMYPLVFACSIPTTYPKAKFKPEYIIPNLVMQWVRNLNEQKVYFGVIYSSSKINHKVVDKASLFYNVAIPTRKNSNNEKYCALLLKNVRMTNPINCSEYFKKVNIDCGIGDFMLDQCEDANKKHFESKFMPSDTSYMKSEYANIENVLDKEEPKLLIE